MPFEWFLRSKEHESPLWLQCKEASGAKIASAVKAVPASRSPASLRFSVLIRPKKARRADLTAGALAAQFYGAYRAVLDGGTPAVRPVPTHFLRQLCVGVRFRRILIAPSRARRR
jgi:hypothetical protein